MRASKLPQPPGAAATLGELLVLNGRQSGARRALAAPVMFVGRAAGCDVRLNVEGIEPFHCVLGMRGGEVTVRDLNSGPGTFVNGQRISAALLRDGDLLDVGPFRFRVLIPAVVAPAAAPERDALRVQVAAVVAQQAALDEEEARLCSQAEELAATRQRHEAERLAWERERADFQAWTAARCAELDQAYVKLERDRRDAEQQPLRLDATAQREQLASAEGRLARRAALLDQVKADLQHKESALALQQVQINTHREVDSRLLQDGWHCLTRDQQRWRQRRTRESMALRVRRALLAEGERKLAGQRAAVAAEQQAWLTRRHQLESELHGLNSRIVHQRQLLAEQDAADRTLARRPAEAEPPVVRASAELDRLTGELADQRALLLEQWERLARIQEQWQSRRDEAARELETLAERLARHDDAVARREHDVEAAEARLRHGQERLDTLRREAGLALARGEAQRRLFESEHADALDAATRLSEQARQQLGGLSSLRRQWNRRRKQEVEALRAERRTLDELRQELTGARHELEEQAQLLENARRTLAEEALALEDDTEPSAAAQRRQEPLRRRWLRLNAAVVRALRQQREALKHELERARPRGNELAALADELAVTRAAADERQTELDHRAALLQAAQADLEQRQREAEQRRAATERRLAALQEESDLLARALIPDGDEPPTALERAA